MKGKYEAPVQKKNSKKGVALLLVLFLLVGCVIGGTVAYLMAEPVTVTNTFTAGNITLELEETTGTTYKMIPGETITKDPTLTVGAGSEACYLFVKVECAKTCIEFEMAEGWTVLDAVNNPGVYYRTVAANSTDDQDFAVLADNQVTVKTNVELDATEDMVITGYAIQSSGLNSAAVAWTTGDWS